MSAFHHSIHTHSSHLLDGGNSESPISHWTVRRKAAGGHLRKHADSTQKSHDLSGKRDLVIVKQNPAGSPASMFHSLLGDKRLWLQYACMNVGACVSQARLVLIFSELVIPHLASANLLSWISSLVCEGVCRLSYFQSCFLLLVAQVAMPFRSWQVPACLPVSSLIADN